MTLRWVITLDVCNSIWPHYELQSKGWEYPIEQERPYYVLTSLTFIVIQLTFKGNFLQQSFSESVKGYQRLLLIFFSYTRLYLRIALSTVSLAPGE